MITEVKTQKKRISYDFLCRYFGVNRASFFNWKKAKDHGLPYLVKKSEILEEIKVAFKKSKETYGSPRIHPELVAKGIVISENTVAKYMKELGLDARLKKKFKVMTTDSKHKLPIAERLFKTDEKDCLPTAPGKVLAGDITYLQVSKGHHIYLAVVMDLYNREIVGWSISDSLETGVVLKALENAMLNTSPDAEVIFHSDRGSQYASEAYRKMLKNNHIKPSMSRKGNCYDNAFVESWFSSLKKEWIYRHEFHSEAQLRQLVFTYIEAWYNTKRRHSSLGMISPVEYRNLNQFGN